MALNGLDEEQIREASWTVQNVTGASAYVYGIDYPKDKFKEELDRAVEHIKKTSGG